MHNEIIIRHLKKQDLLPLLKIIRHTWKFDNFSSPKIAQKLSQYYLYSYLTDQTDIFVAEISGKMVGIIMGKNISKYKTPKIETKKATQTKTHMRKKTTETFSSSGSYFPKRKGIKAKVPQRT